MLRETGAGRGVVHEYDRGACAVKSLRPYSKHDSGMNGGGTHRDVCIGVLTLIVGDVHSLEIGMSGSIVRRLLSAGDLQQSTRMREN